MASSGNVRVALTAAVATRVTMPDPASMTRRLPWNGEKSNEKAPPASLVTVCAPTVIAIAPSACPPFVAVRRPLMVAIVGAGGVGVTIGAGAGVGVVGVELPQAEAIRATTSSRCRMYPH